MIRCAATAISDFESDPIRTPRNRIRFTCDLTAIPPKSVRAFFWNATHVARVFLPISGSGALPVV